MISAASAVNAKPNTPIFNPIPPPPERYYQLLYDATTPDLMTTIVNNPVGLIPPWEYQIYKE
jgi:hypothetical protein